MKIKSILLSLLLLPITTFIHASFNASFNVNNNFNYATSTVTVYFSGGSEAWSSVGNISAWGSFLFMYNTPEVITQVTVDNAYAPNNTSNFIIIPSSTDTSINIYTNYLITNNSSTPLTIRCYDSGGATLTGTMPINAYQSLQFVTGTAGIKVYDATNSILLSSPITLTSNTSYQITYDGTDYSVATYTPTLTNNSTQSQTVSDLYFYDSNSTQINSSAITMTPAGTTVIPGQAATFECTAYDTTITIQATFPTENIFTTNYIENNSTENITINYSGTINGVSSTIMNADQIAINAAGSNQIITGATSFTAYDNVGNLITFSDGSTSVAINSSLTYYLNLSADGSWSYSTTGPTYYLTNNSSTATGSLHFYTSESVLISTISGIAAGSYAAIPATTGFAEFQQTLSSTVTTINTICSDTASSNIYTNQSVTNSSASDVYILYNDGALNGPAIKLTASGGNFPIITGATTFTIQSPLGTDVITDYPIVAGNNYFINTGNTVSTTAVVNTLKNNYSTTATTVKFFNSSAVQQGSTVGSIVAGASTNIPNQSTVYATIDTQTINATSTALKIPFPAATDVKIVTNYTLTNNGPSTVYAVYYGNISNGSSNPQKINATAIAIASTAACPIITGAASVNIYSNAGATTLLTVGHISTGQSYYINDTYNGWNISEVAQNYSLTNNSSFATGAISFYNGVTLISSITSLAAWAHVTIPAGTTIIEAVGLYGSTNIPFNINIAGSTHQNINLYTNYVIANHSTSPILVTCYQQDNTTVAGQMPMITGQSLQIVYGTADIQVSNLTESIIYVPMQSITTTISSYEITDDGSWALTAYTPVLVNNSSDKSSASMALLNSNNQEITNGFITVDYGDSLNILGNVSYATVIYPYGTVYVPMTFESSENVFTPYTIYNSSSQSIQATFEGSLNGSATTYTISTPITIAANSSLNIITGAENVVLNAGTTSIGSNPNTLTPFTSYTVSYETTTNTWSFAATPPYLINNCNQPLTNLIFYDAGSIQISLPISLAAYGSTLIPLTAASATFTQFGASISIPISYLVSSNIYLPYQITNEDLAQTAAITFNTGIATPTINVAPLASLPILTSTTSFFVSPNLTVNAPYLNSYDITFSTPNWSIANEIVTLTNNSDQLATTISFYDATDTFISSVSNVQPWQNITIPTGAASAVVTYPTYSVITIMSDQQSSKIFTHNLLNNNYGQVVSVNYYGYLDGASNTLLNETPIVIETGQAIPFITGTHSVSIIASGITMVSNAPIGSSSYEITSIGTMRRLSSALATIRLLGGSMPVAPSLFSANLYGYDSLLFAEFLYVDAYAQVITDLTARTATVTAVKAILTTYAADYIIQPNFNYISYLYLIYGELDAAELILITQYLESLEQIEQFFDYLKEHAANLL